MWFWIAFLVWVVVWFAARYAFLRWRRWRYEQPARYISEIRSVEYYRSLPAAQFEALVMQVFRAQGLTMLGDAYLGRSRVQGYAWKAGQKLAWVHCLEKPLTPEEIDDLAKRQVRAQATKVLVLSPFPRVPASRHPAVEIIAGRKLLGWFSVLADVRPSVPQEFPGQKCECGAPTQQRVNRAGRPLLVCSRYPDCRIMQKPIAKTTPPETNLAAK